MYYATSGQREESHVVLRGENLTMIARRYYKKGWHDLTSWRPIYRITGRRTGLWANPNRSRQVNNPDLIYPGDLLVIPRSRTAYKNAIANLSSLLQDSRNQPRYAAEVKEQEESFTEGLNLASSVLTTIASLGLTASSAAKAAKTTIRAAAGQALKKKALSIAELGTNVVAYEAKSTGHEEIAKYAEGAGKVLHTADLLGDVKNVRKDGKELLKDRKYWKLAGDSLGQVVDYLDVAFEWTEPAKLSKGVIKLFTGDDVDKTIEENVKSEQRMADKMHRMLQKRISNLISEVQFVYSD